jgi:hypothetical protein
VNIEESQYFIEIRVLFVTAGAFAIIGALSYLIIVGRIEPLNIKTA